MTLYIHQWGVGIFTHVKVTQKSSYDINNIYLSYSNQNKIFIKQLVIYIRFNQICDKITGTKFQ